MSKYTKNKHFGGGKKYRHISPFQVYTKRNKRRKVLTFGVYDLLHLGHILLFKHAREKGDYLIVAVQDSDTVLKYKPNAQIFNGTDEREMMVSSIRYVNEVTTYRDVDEDIKHIDFDVLVTGPDQIHEGFQRAFRWCEDHGKQHIVIPRTEGVSSSYLRELIKSNGNEGNRY